QFCVAGVFRYQRVNLAQGVSPAARPRYSQGGSRIKVTVFAGHCALANYGIRVSSRYVKGRSGRVGQLALLRAIGSRHIQLVQRAPLGLRLLQGTAMLALIPGKAGTRGSGP